MTEFSTGGYPLGAENDPRAPYNQPDPKKIKVKVLASVTYSKELEVEVEEGYTDADLCDAVKNLEILPNDLIANEHARLRKFLKKSEQDLSNAYKKFLIERRDKFKPWHEDEFEVVENF
jgi:hypothetical protein